MLDEVKKEWTGLAYWTSLQMTFEASRVERGDLTPWSPGRPNGNLRLDDTENVVFIELKSFGRGRKLDPHTDRVQDVRSLLATRAMPFDTSSPFAS